MKNLGVGCFLILHVYAVQALRIQTIELNVPLVASELTEAHNVTRIMEAFSFLADAEMYLDKKIAMEKVMISVQILAKHFNVEPFVLITEQRSGSGWLISLLNSHPEIASFGEYFLSVTQPQSLQKAFEHMSAWVKNKPHMKRIGFKLMLNQMEKVEDLWNERLSMNSAPTFILHWRRNVLRRLISNSANRENALNSSHYEEDAHPRTSASAQNSATFKPRIDAKNLVYTIEQNFNARGAVARSIKKHQLPTCSISHYEEWVVHSEEAQQSFLNCLQLSPHILDSDLVSIHNHQEILETVANPLDVSTALQNSKYSFMLEEGATSDEILENLKKSDSFD